jgi:isopenicillin N synthase-like dioxygenase
LISPPFQVKGHSIPEDVIQNAIKAGKKFWALPEDVKMEVRYLIIYYVSMSYSTPHQLDIHKSSNFKGYTALLSENTNPAGMGDLHEGFDLGWEEPVHDETGNTKSSSQEGTAMTGMNVWPDEKGLTSLKGFKEDVLKY